MEDNFKFGITFDVLKSGDGEMRIGGLASTPKKDRQNDRIIQKGLDISNFIRHGFLNFDHDQEKILGYPDAGKTKITSDGFYVEGVLLKSNPLACEIYRTALELQETNAPRRFGYSVEGKTLERDINGDITKAAVYNVAITPNPVNTEATWEALVKSFAAGEDVEIEKALEAGGNGNALIPESLEQAFHTLAKAFDDDDEAKRHIDGLKDRLKLKKSLPKHELVLYFQLFKGLSFSTANDLVDQFLKEDSADD